MGLCVGAAAGVRVRRGAVALALSVALAGCTGAVGETPAEPDGTFALPDETEVACLEHQQETPGPAYTGGADGDTAAILGMLRYWASYGDKPYCDGAPASEVDQQWRDLVVDLGATRPPDPPPAPAGESPPEDGAADPTAPGGSTDSPTPVST